MKLSGITMVIRSLGFGGAEQTLSLIANSWASRGLPITFIISTPPTEVDYFHLHPSIKKIHLPLDKPNLMSHFEFPWSVKALRRCIKEAGHPVVLSFMDRSNVPVILATRGLGVKVIICEQIDPRTQKYRLGRRVFKRLCYPLADALTVLTENVKRDWASKIVNSDKVHVIYNPVRPDNDMIDAPEWLPEKFICCMGRLHHQKGFDKLFTVLPDVFKQYPDYKLVILGEGEARAELEAQLQELGLSEQVIMPGFVPSPFRVLRRADLFVLSSRFEGLPGALLEAMSLGLPVVSFDCPSGPCVLIRDGINGVLVPAMHIEQMRDQIIRLLGDDELRSSLGKQARLDINASCNLAHIIQTWEQLIGRLMKGTYAEPIITRMSFQAETERDLLA